MDEVGLHQHPWLCSQNPCTRTEGHDGDFTFLSICAPLSLTLVNHPFCYVCSSIADKKPEILCLRNFFLWIFYVNF